MMNHGDTAEAYVIGAVMVDPSVMDELAAEIETKHFGNAAMRRIYKAMLAIWRDGSTVEPVAVSTRLEEGDISLLEEINSIQGTAANAKHYAEQVRTEAQRRELIRISRVAKDGAEDRARDPRDVVDETAASLHSLTVQGSEAVYGCSDGLVKTHLAIEERWKKGGGPVGITTPFKTLTRKLGGWEPGRVYVIGGRPGAGKSAVSLQLSLCAAKHGNKVLWAGTEGTEEQLYQRVLSAASGIPIPRLKTGNISAGEWPGLTTAMNSVAPTMDNMALLYLPGLNATKLRAHAMKCQRTFGLDMLVVDYIQRMKPDRSGASKYEAVSDASNAITDLAMELDIPILLLAQVKRELESRSPGKNQARSVLQSEDVEMREPALSDLSNSGTIEQDAAVVLFIHRKFRDATTGALLCAKHRDGESEWRIPLDFDPNRVCFREQ